MTESAFIELLNASKSMASSPTLESCCQAFLKAVSFLGVTEGWMALPDWQSAIMEVQSLSGVRAPFSLSEHIAQMVTVQFSQSPNGAVLSKQAWPVGAFGSTIDQVIFIPAGTSASDPGGIILGITSEHFSAEVLSQVKMLTEHAAIHLSNVSLRGTHERTIRYLREFDDLVTKLPNRRRFCRLLNEALSSAQTPAPVGVLFADLDNFNAINQRFGYSAGDRVLLEVSQRWQKALQQAAPQAMLARMWGDEFACLLVTSSEVRNAEGIAQRLLASVREPLHLQSERWILTASIGIACNPGNGTHVDELLHSVELAMNAAKERGKGCCHSASELRCSATAPAQSKE